MHLTLESLVDHIIRKYRDNLPLELQVQQGIQDLISFAMQQGQGSVAEAQKLLTFEDVVPDMVREEMERRKAEETTVEEAAESA